MSFHLIKTLRLVSLYGRWQVLQLQKCYKVFLHLELQHSVKDNPGTHFISTLTNTTTPSVHKPGTCHKQMWICHAGDIVTCTFALTRLRASPLYLPCSFTPPSFLCHCFSSPRQVSVILWLSDQAQCCSPRCLSCRSNQAGHKQLLPLGMCTQLCVYRSFSVPHNLDLLR